MAFVPGAEFDVFISYSWADNQSGWVTSLEKALTENVWVLLGQRPAVWLDTQQLTGEQNFTAVIEQRLEKSAALVAILSRGYFKSDYCRQERQHYRAKVPAHVGQRSRLLTAIKEPHPNGLERSVVPEAFGFPFHQGANAIEPGQEGFRTGVRKLAKGLCNVLEELANAQSAIYIAEPVPKSLTPVWKRLREELGRQGFRVLPDDRLDEHLQGDHISQPIEESLITVHLLDGPAAPFARQQLARARQLGKPCLLWYAPASVGNEPEPAPGEIILRNLPDYDLERIVLEEARKRRPAASAAPSDSAASTTTATARSVYLLHDRKDPADAPAAQELKDQLEKAGLAVRLPEIDRDPAILDELHIHRLTTCDAVLLYWGHAWPQWFAQQCHDLALHPRPGRVAGALLGPGPARELPAGLPVFADLAAFHAALAASGGTRA